MDLSFWNLNLERLITVKIIFEMPTYGGVEVVYQVSLAQSPLVLRKTSSDGSREMAADMLATPPLN